jgi:hypothetical protein
VCVVVIDNACYEQYKNNLSTAFQCDLSIILIVDECGRYVEW